MSARLWPEDTVFSDLVLVPQCRTCDLCGAFMPICDHRFHPISTLQGPIRIVAKLVHCPNKACPASKRTVSPEEELLLAMPGWSIGWDVFSYIGFRRFKYAYCVREIREELLARFDVALKDATLEWYIRRYQTMVSAKWLDIEALKETYRDTSSIVLTIDGLKPDQSHETLYVVRELTQKRVWFAATLKASDQGEINALFLKAKELAATLGLTVRAWMSDKQEAFVNAVQALFPGTLHLLCRNHFLRKLAEPVTAIDKAAVKTLRDKVKGLREIERKMEAIVATAPAAASPSEIEPPPCSSAAPPESGEPTGTRARRASDALKAQAQYETAHEQDVERASAVLDYATVLRGILSDSKAGPLKAASVTMVSRLDQVNASMQHCADMKKGGPASPPCAT